MAPNDTDKSKCKTRIAARLTAANLVGQIAALDDAVASLPGGQTLGAAVAREFVSQTAASGC